MLGGDHFDSTPAGGAPSGNWFLSPLIPVENVVGENLRLNPRFHASAHRAQRFHPVHDFLFAYPPPCRTSRVTQLALLPVQHTEPTHIFEASRCFTETNDPCFIRTTVSGIWLEQVLDTLTEEERRIVQEFYINGKNEREACAALGLPKTTFRRREQRLREKLGILLKNFL